MIQEMKKMNLIEAILSVFGLDEKPKEIKADNELEEVATEVAKGEEE